MKTIEYYMSPWRAPRHPAEELPGDRRAGGGAQIGARHGVARGDEERYRAFTQEALERGVFGAPSYVYRDEIFWARTASNSWNAP